jgi:excisionase family DNA binding protein
MREIHSAIKSESEKFEESLLRKKQVAKMLACSLRTVDRLVIAGRLTRVKILGGVRFRLSQVQMLMNGGKHDFQG